MIVFLKFFTFSALLSSIQSLRASPRSPPPSIEGFVIWTLFLSDAGYEKFGLPETFPKDAAPPLLILKDPPGFLSSDRQPLHLVMRFQDIFPLAYKKQRHGTPISPDNP